MAFVSALLSGIEYACKESLRAREQTGRAVKEKQVKTPAPRRHKRKVTDHERAACASRGRWGGWREKKKNV